jgi:hypothetical protein
MKKRFFLRTGAYVKEGMAEGDTDFFFANESGL